MNKRNERETKRDREYRSIRRYVLIFWCVLLCVSAGVLLKQLLFPAENTEKEQGTQAPPPMIQALADQAVRTAGPGRQDESGEDGEGDQAENPLPTEGPALTPYPAPAYPFRTEEVTIAVPGLSREYTLAWVSDVHMITDHGPADDVMEEFTDTIEQRYEQLFVTGNEKPVYSADLWPEIVKYLNYGDFDGIIFGGDMMDYCSRSNMDAFLQEYEQLNPEIPLLYIRADHDYGAWYGGEVWTQDDVYELHQSIDGDNLYEKYLDFGEFMVIGINGSTGDMTSEQYEIVSRLYAEGKPVIIATHVPYASFLDGSLEEVSMEVRGVKYYWGDGIYVADEITWKYLTEMIYSADTHVCGVLAGHLHASWDGPLTEQVSQHIFSPAFQGVIGIIHIVPEE